MQFVQIHSCRSVLGLLCAVLCQPVRDLLLVCTRSATCYLAISCSVRRLPCGLCPVATGAGHHLIYELINIPLLMRVCVPHPGDCSRLAPSTVQGKHRGGCEEREPQYKENVRTFDGERRLKSVCWDKLWSSYTSLRHLDAGPSFAYRGII